MLLGSRPQEKWIMPPDNSQLEVYPSNQQVFRANTFAQNFQQHMQQFQKFLIYLRNPYQKNKQVILINEKSKLFEAIVELEKDDHLIIETFNEKALSYKGYISWLLLANSNVCYLIDCAILHNDILYLQHILENPKVIKVALRVAEVSKNLKRDFGIFLINLFHLDLLQFLHPQLKPEREKINIDIEAEFEKTDRIMTQRPIPSQLFGLMKRYFSIMISYLTRLPHKPIQDKFTEISYMNEIKYIYEHCNDPKKTLDHYEHKIEKFKTQLNFQNLNIRQENLINLLIEFREHMSKMRDISPSFLLPNSIIDSIVKDNVNSVLQISELYKERSKNLGMEVYNRIYNTIQLNQQKFDDLEGLPGDFLERYIPCTPARERSYCKDIKRLLKEIDWGESSEWLNRKNDPSIRLYKEIISISQFDESIFEEFIDSMKGEGLKKSELDKFLKYAEYMRGKNKRKLQQYHEMKIIQEKEERENEKSQKKIFNHFDSQFSNPSDYIMEEVEEHDEEFQEDEESPKKWNKGANRTLFQDDDDEDESFTEEKDIKQEEKKISFFPIKSSIVVERKKQQNGFNFEKTSSQIRKESTELTMLSEMSEISREPSDYSNEFFFEEEPDRSSIKPLPNNIEEIYIQAIEAKKKISKKNSRKKEKKQNKVQKKEVEFVPKLEDIQELLRLKKSTNNLK